MQERVLGYILFFIGIAIIVFAAVDVYLVFTKQKKPIDLFSFSGISIDMSQALSASLPAELKASAFTLPPVQQEIIAPELVNQPMNIFSHVFFMGFVASIGMKLSSLGTMLMRPITVKLKEEKPEKEKATASAGR